MGGGVTLPRLDLDGYGFFIQQSVFPVLNHCLNFLFSLTEKDCVALSADCVRLVQSVSAPLANRQCVAQFVFSDCLWSAVHYWVSTLCDDALAVSQTGKLDCFRFVVYFDAVEKRSVCFRFGVGIV